jgi:hypothetical protein
MPGHSQLTAFTAKNFGVAKTERLPNRRDKGAKSGSARHWGNPIVFRLVLSTLNPERPQCCFAIRTAGIGGRTNVAKRPCC